MAMMPFGPGVGGMLFGQGGGAAGSQPVQVGGGKNSRAQDLVSPHSGLKATTMKGDPLSRSMSQYGKGHSFTSGTPNSGLHQIRGGVGQMRRIRGGLGPGKVGQAGPSGKDYSMLSGDTE